MASTGLSASPDSIAPANIAEICDRLRNIETNLHSVIVEHVGAGFQAGDILEKAVSDLAVVREALRSFEGASSAPKSKGTEHAEDKERIERAVSEMKSGEFDVQG